MINQLIDSSSLAVLEQVVSFAQARHGVLAGNIANVHTPGYKTRDLSVEQFQTNLREAIEAQHQPPGLSVQSPGLSSEGNGIQSFDQVRESLKDILHHDGTDVSLERQITEIGKNRSLHNTAITLMAAQFRQLEVAISERVI